MSRGLTPVSVFVGGEGIMGWSWNSSTKSGLYASTVYSVRVQQFENDQFPLPFANSSLCSTPL
jgi:hypothetical protein